MSRLMISVSGVRGVVGEDLTGEVAGRFARAFASTLPAGGRVALGRDTRPSGPMLAGAVVAGLTGGGINVVDLGVVSTPGVALMIRRLRADGGVVITASHNPSPYNGIKFMTPAGVNLPADRAGRLKEIWEAGHFAPAPAPGTVTTDERTHAAHVEAVCKVVDVPAIAARRFKVVLDSINGAGCGGSPLLLDRLGCRLVHINADPTGEFAHEPEPVERNLTGLCAAVRESGADVGFAQDPDADRLAIVDERGGFIGEEYSVTLASAFVLRGRRGDIATNLSTTRMMDDVAAAAGVKCHRCPVGEANVAELMAERNCIFGGEGGGGVMDPRVICVRDSFVGMALVLNYLAETGKTVSGLVGAVPRYEMLKDKFPCPAGAAEAVIAAAGAAFAAGKGARIDRRDGLRVDLSDRWVGIRASNTEPIMRITAEAPTTAAAADLARRVRDIADRVLGK